MQTYSYKIPYTKVGKDVINIYGFQIFFIVVYTGKQKKFNLFNKNVHLS